MAPPDKTGPGTCIVLLLISGVLFFSRIPIAMVIAGLCLAGAIGTFSGRKDTSKKYLQWARTYRCNACGNDFLPKH